jgi:EAL domain-containing protein (putative c-di-GMP-specific phosphodiesterase class I)/GGDEF domain-containing protein
MADHSEEARLSALQQLGLLDTGPSESFDRITRMASQIFGLPIAAVSLTDRDRQWFKSRVGVDHTSIPRDKAPCAAVAESRDLLVVPDLLADPWYKDSVLAQSGIRFYAGAPLTTREGFSLGAMCVLGTQPREATPAETAALSDLAAMVMSQIELQHAFGRIDPVSGLPNRTQFEDDLEDLARDNPGGLKYSAVAIDLATSEEVSQAARVLGGSYLDDLVREATANLRLALGPDRKAYHVGMNQLAFLSPPDTNSAAYIDVLNVRLEQIRKGAMSRFTATPVIGVVPFVLGRMKPRDVLRLAQSAVQDARINGATISAYSASHDEVYQRRFSLLNDFGNALESGQQLRLVYQPRVDLASGRCVGLEALLRWRHPTLGDISPAEFIPIIEQSPLVRDTTAWVLTRAVSQLSEWRLAALDLQVSVNVSVSNLREADFAARVIANVAACSLPPSSLELEVTESAVMTGTESAAAQLEAIAAAGIRLAIDDFGTGYSSLSYLQQLPARTLKIDRSFVNGCETDARKAALISAMVTLAHDLNYKVVAEGVETQACLDRLAELGCDEVQGYFFARPMEASALIQWLAGFHRTEATSEAA